MSQPAYEIVRPDGQRAPEPAMLGEWTDRLEQARNDRRKYEPTWKMAQLFLQGAQWVGVAGTGRDARVIELANPQNRERHTVNVLTQYFWTIVGKMTSAPMQPSISFATADERSKLAMRHTNKTVRYLLEEEIGAEEVGLERAMTVVQYGTAAVRHRWDSLVGEELGQVPVDDEGNPIVDPDQARAFVAETVQSGGKAQFTTLREGAPVWEVFSPLQLYPPPGSTSPRKLPWLIVGQPTTVGDVEQMFPDTGKGIQEENLAAIDTVGVADMGSGPWGAQGGVGNLGKLKGHVMLYTGYEKPCPKYPQGRVVHFTEQRFLRQIERLPYKRRGRWEFGIEWYFYHRVKDRLWGIGAVEQGMGPQYQRNVARSQMIEMKDRLGLGRVFATKNTLEAADVPVGKIAEVVWVKPGHQIPQESSGIGPGPWLEAEVRMNDEDLDRAMGQRDVSLGNAPQGVSAYSAMALLKDSDDQRLGPILKAHRTGDRNLVRWAMMDVKRLWPAEKHLALGGDKDVVETWTFLKNDLPDEFYVSMGTGPSQPMTPAAETQKAFDLFDRSIATGRPLPLTWLYDSLEAGKALPIPDDQMDAHRGKAELEDSMMMRGEPVQPLLYDNDAIHLQVHKVALVQLAQLVGQVPGAEQGVMLIQLHVQAHELQQQLKMAAMQPGMASNLQIAPPQGGGAAGDSAGGQMQVGQAYQGPSPIAPQ